MVMSGLSVKLTRHFLGRIRPPKRLTSTSCTYFTSTWSFLSKQSEKWKYLAGSNSVLLHVALESDALSTALPGPAFKVYDFGLTI